MTGALADLSTTAKLVHVVLAERGPLCPNEIADEAHMTVESTTAALDELTNEGVVEPVCGVPATREQVYAVTQDLSA